METESHEYEGGFLPLAWFFAAGLVAIIVAQVLWLLFVIGILGFLLTPVLGGKVPSYGLIVFAVWVAGVFLIPVVLPYVTGKQAMKKTTSGVKGVGRGFSSAARGTRDFVRGD